MFRFHEACAMLVILSYLFSPNWVGSQVQGQVPRLPKPAQTASCRAMILVQTAYPWGALNANHRTEAIALGFELARAGYVVDIVTDSASAPGAKEDLKKLKEKLTSHKSSEITISEADDTVTAEKMSTDWIQKVAKDKCLLAIYVVSGHGVERETEPTFLTVKDTTEMGGLPLDTIFKTAAKATTDLPLIVVWNTCRLAAAPAKDPAIAPLVVKDPQGKKVEIPNVKPADPMAVPPGGVVSASDDWLSKRKPFYEIRTLDAVARKGRAVPTVLFSTRSGKQAQAAQESNPTVIGYLAQALSDKTMFDAFLKAIYPNRLQQNSIRLQEWTHYAVSHFQKSNLEQSYELALGGSIGLDAIIASRTQTGLEAPKNPQGSSNLLEGLLVKDAGDISLVHELNPRPSSLAVTLPGGALNAPWAGTKLPQPEGVDPTGKVLVLDYVAERGRNTPANAKGLIFIFNPTYRLPDDQGHYVNLILGKRSTLADPANTPPFLGVFGQPNRAVLPLQIVLSADKTKVLPLDSLGFAKGKDIWPSDATVRVLRMELVPQRQIGNAQVGLNVQPLNLDLFPGNWVGGDLSPGFPNLKTDSVGPALLLTPQTKGTLCRTGGRLSTSMYIPKGFLLRIEVSNTGQKESELLVDLLREDDQKKPQVKFVTPENEPQRKIMKVPAGATKSVRDIPISDSGWANYLSLSTNSEGLKISRIALVKDPKQ